MVYFDTVHEAYSVWQVRKAMTVRELIDALEEFADDTQVYFRNDGGYTYGGVTLERVNED